jgi:hypothetical protein
MSTLSAGAKVIAPVVACAAAAEAGGCAAAAAVSVAVFRLTAGG